MHGRRTFVLFPDIPELLLTVLVDVCGRCVGLSHGVGVEEVDGLLNQQGLLMVATVARDRCLSANEPQSTELATTAAQSHILLAE